MAIAVRYLLIRADAGPIVGAGHVMRCFALAEAWIDAGGQVLFLTRTESTGLDSRLAEIGDVLTPVSNTASVADAEWTASEARRVSAAWAVVDGYDFDAAFERRVATTGCKVLSIDDLGERREYACHALLNQNAYADAELYASCPTPKMKLLGTRYALLRKEFRDRKDPPREHPKAVRKLLISMGGGDSRRVTPVVLDALRKLRPKGLEVTLVVGPNNPYLASLQEKANNVGFPVSVESGTRRMADLMAASDAAVQAGGSTVWESCRMGLPSLIVCLAENQRRIVESTAAAGAAESLGWYQTLSPESLAIRLQRFLSNAEGRRAMSESAVRLVDGRGAIRVRDALLEAS